MVERKKPSKKGAIAKLLDKFDAKLEKKAKKKPCCCECAGKK